MQSLFCIFILFFLFIQFGSDKILFYSFSAFVCMFVFVVCVSVIHFRGRMCIEWMCRRKGKEKIKEISFLHVYCKSSR